MDSPSILATFATQVWRAPAETAIEWRDRQISYGDLDELASRIAAWLISSGAQPRDLIAVAVDNSFFAIPVLLGIWKAAGVFVPMDANNPDSRLSAMVSAVHPAWAITDGRASDVLARVWPDGHGRMLKLDSDALPEALAAEMLGQRAAALTPDQLSYIAFTSGSTGKPKAIAGRTKGLSHFIEWEARTFGVGERCRISQFAHPAFDVFFRDVLLPLSVGGTICIPDSRETLLDGFRLRDWIEQRRVEIIHCVPSLFRTLLRADLRAGMFQHLRLVLLAGEALAPANVRKWQGIFGERIELVNLYGATETTMVKFFHRIRREDGERKTIPIGKPMEGARAIIVDEQERVCPLNAVGEIYIRTPFRTLGYYQDPEATARVFIRNPFSEDPSDIVYRTGDLGRLRPDGLFEFVGRADSQVKIRGVRLELGEIESVLRACGGILDAAVIAAEEEHDVRLIAYVVAAQEPDWAALRDQLLTSLPVNFVPASFVRLDALPRTANGKVDRRALPLPERERSGLTAYREPETQTEKQLAAIWSELLGIERIGADDDFFALGGHSLMATQLMARIRSGFDIEAPLGRLFENPTLSRLALAIEEAQFEAADERTLSEVLEEMELHHTGAGAGQ